MKTAKKLLAISAFVSVVMLPTIVDACTRVVYHGDKGQVITARSMDWNTDTMADLWVFPKGMQRDGAAGKNSISWTSKYGSITASAYNAATVDGVNEKGLMANMLWLAESEYPGKDNNKPRLSMAAWAQYMLDNYASVAEAVTALQHEPFKLVTDKVPGQSRNANVHLSLSDASGDSAIIEYIGGKQVITHGRQYQVMTNSPIYAEQLALVKYWKDIGGTVMLPGTNRAADRFARASFYVNAIPKFKQPDMAVASMFSVIRNASVPYGLNTPDQPNISSTQWRSVTDHGRGLYFFESTLTPNVFWVDVKALDLSEHGKVLKLALGKNQTNVFSGKVNGQFKEAPPFAFLEAKN